ncbi:MAG: GIY-YIG nuclease family protein [bacterium]|nr:GIY-YIG nuclease family protein [bacterium]
MYSVYILKSTKDNNLYIGATGNLQKRLSDHNEGQVFATKSRLPLKLVYCEVYQDKRDAFKREKMLKHNGQGLRRLKERLAYSLSS